MENYQATIRPAYAVDEAQSALLRSVFGWMTLGLLTTAVVSSYVVSNPEFLFKLGNAIWFLIIAELGLVVWLAARVMKMSPGTATAVFLGYSALNGITLAPLAFVYTQQSITSAFVVAGGLFGTMALYGYVTKRDLSSMGSFLFMGLIGIVIAGIANLFIQSSMMGFVISVVAVLVFTGLTAWDVQKIKQMGAQVTVESDNFRRFAILGALSLYLDFINLFIHLLRLIGNRD